MYYEGVEDLHQPSNAQRYHLRNLVLGAFAVFYMQCPSFLEHHRQMQSRHEHNNAQRLWRDNPSSAAIHCTQCSHRTHKNGPVSHRQDVILPVIVAPGQEQVIFLMPEFICPQDGAQEQDSETAAGKRWIKAHHDLIAPGHLTVLGDDLSI